MRNCKIVLLLICVWAAVLIPGQVLSACADSGYVFPDSAELVPKHNPAALTTTYEIFVGSFYDTDGDSIGDLKGVLSKLDYIGSAENPTGDSLGCDTIWLMPVFPSPSYHKYDVTNYKDIDPVYGTLEDLDALIGECHARGMKLILDLPLNHSSTEHPWFREAADYLTSLPEDTDPVESDCPYVWYYHFSREPYEGYAQLPDTDWYYEARFVAGMPDLALEHDSVKKEISEILRFWLERGVDGFRLDAVTSLFTGDNAANIDFLSWLHNECISIREDTYLVGEAWCSQEEYAPYYASGIDSLFDFAFSGQEGYIARTVKGSMKASRFAQLLEEEEALYASYNESYLNAPFYTNHDMARSTGYYAYDDGSRTKLAGALNLLTSGNAFLYYGEELGMKGSGKDENKRAPMQWVQEESEDSSKREGMTAGPPEMDAVKHKFGSLEEQEKDPESIFRYFQNVILVRDSFPAVSRGKTRAVDDLSTEKVAAIRKTLEEGGPDGQDLLILINCSEEEQTVDLSGYEEGRFSSPAAELTVSKEKVKFDGRELYLPAFGIAVLQPA